VRVDEMTCALPSARLGTSSPPSSPCCRSRPRWRATPAACGS